MATPLFRDTTLQQDHRPPRAAIQFLIGPARRKSALLARILAKPPTWRIVRVLFATGTRGRIHARHRHSGRHDHQRDRPDGPLAATLQSMAGALLRLAARRGRRGGRSRPTDY